jgi:hypothetical protein
VAYHLARDGIAFRTTEENGVCVSDDQAARVEDAMRRLDRYFWKVDRLLRDPCEERALVDWAAKEGLRFDVGNVVDLKGDVAGRTFRLFSYTQQELEANRRKLDEAPKEAQCKPTSAA